MLVIEVAHVARFLAYIYARAYKSTLISPPIKKNTEKQRAATPFPYNEEWPAVHPNRNAVLSKWMKNGGNEERAPCKKAYSSSWIIDDE